VKTPTSMILLSTHHNTPVPEDDDDDLICDNLVCIDDDPCLFTEAIDLAWRFEVDIRQQDFDQ
jgi:hypothetical protein